MPPPSSSQKYLYRGVHAGHPAYAAALQGVVIPGDIDSHISPEQHNGRDVSGQSCYTSWTHSREIAEFFADAKGRGGILLRVPVGAPEACDSWRWEHSPDGWLEDEMLLFGIRIGVEVIQR